MAVSAGRKGSVTVWTSSGTGNLTVAEMGSWSISGPSLNMIDFGSFGDERGRQKPGMMTAQTITFDGYHDVSTSTGPSPQAHLQVYLSSGTPIYASSKLGIPCYLRLWANTDSDLSQFGFWAQTSSTSLSVKSYVTGMEVGQNKDGVGTISFTVAVTGGSMVWTTST